MRVRNAAIAAFGAMSLVLTIPTSASAAIGEFQYRYTDANGHHHIRALLDPAGQQCITLPEVADPATMPADSPRNRTTASATVFAEADCEGDTYYTLRPLTGYGTTKMKIRSVAFSE
ncbi:hypothetical protein ACGFXC_32940 [Streptomyces sp. NPDC048507]|uniref:hypothetical protein n=1 Tax=Streptomyces sp. NPDC048507 TaxID=3365560 RepID=UPI003716D006